VYAQKGRQNVGADLFPTPIILAELLEEKTRTNLVPAVKAPTTTKQAGYVILFAILAERAFSVAICCVPLKVSEPLAVPS
jgi:hypothetical protein